MIHWEALESDSFAIYRTKVPGGWFVIFYIQASGIVGESSAGSITFYPDPDHEWDGSSLP